MPKKLLVLLSVIPLTLFCCCKSKNAYAQNVSQLRCDVLKYECEDFSLVAYCDTKESPLTDDGAVGKADNFLVFKLTPKAVQNYDNCFVQFYINDRAYTGNFEFKQIAFLLTCSVLVDEFPQSELPLSLTVNGKAKDLALVSLRNKTTENWTSACEKALAEDDAAALLSTGKYELRIRLIDNAGYDYWYVGIIAQGKTVSYLLDGETLEIIAKKDG